LRLHAPPKRGAAFEATPLLLRVLARNKHDNVPGLVAVELREELGQIFAPQSRFVIRVVEHSAYRKVECAHDFFDVLALLACEGNGDVVLVFGWSVRGCLGLVLRRFAGLLVRHRGGTFLHSTSD
jgi:hypothetical protein